MPKIVEAARKSKKVVQDTMWFRKYAAAAYCFFQNFSISSAMLRKKGAFVVREAEIFRKQILRIVYLCCYIAYLHKGQLLANLVSPKSFLLIWLSICYVR